MSQHIATRWGGVRSGPVLIAITGLLLAVILCVVAATRPFNNTPDIRSDGVGYHAWVHALAHGDLSFCRYEPLLKRVAAISGKSLDGTRCRNKYPPGVGLLQLPFSFAFLAEHPSRTGYSDAENTAVRWIGAGLLLATAGLMYGVLARRKVRPAIAIVSIAAFVFGTGLFHYATYDASFSHIYSAFGVALLMWLVLDRETFSRRRLVACIAVVAWLYLVRQTNAALALAVVYVAIRHTLEAQARPQGVRLGLAWLVGTGAAVVTLLAYGFYVGGTLTVSNYGSEGFPSFAAHAHEVLLSYERGLFTYYPVFIIAVVAAILQVRKAVNQAFLGVVVVFALLYGSWHVWHLGGGFGHRGFVEVAPFGMLVVGDALARWSPRKRRVATWLIALCCSVTLLAMAAYWRGDLPFNGAVPPQFWRSISPASLFIDNKFIYTQDDGRHITLSVAGTRRLSDGTWLASVRVHNGNPSTTIYADTRPGLDLSWRVKGPGPANASGWDPRAAFPSLAPGESKTMAVRVPAPSKEEDGTTLQFSFVEDGVFWAHDIGVPPVSIPWTNGTAAPDNKLDL